MLTPTLFTIWKSRTDLTPVFISTHLDVDRARGAAEIFRDSYNRTTGGDAFLTLQDVPLEIPETEGASLDDTQEMACL